MTNARPGSNAGAEEAPDREYGLYIRTSKSSFYFINRNCGVTLAADRIAWAYDGRDDAALFSSIRSVHLQTAGSWQSPIGVCRITFADRYELMVTDANDRGSFDPERHKRWRDFVHDFHARLASSGNAAIKYTTGLQGHRYLVVIALAMVLSIMALIVPFVGMIALGSLAPLPVLLAGIALVWPLYQMIEKNAPGTYDPGHLPKDLLR